MEFAQTIVSSSDLACVILFFFNCCLLVQARLQEGVLCVCVLPGKMSARPARSRSPRRSESSPVQCREGLAATPLAGRDVVDPKQSASIDLPSPSLERDASCEPGLTHAPSLEHGQGDQQQSPCLASDGLTSDCLASKGLSSSPSVSEKPQMDYEELLWRDSQVSSGWLGAAYMYFGKMDF